MAVVVKFDTSEFDVKVSELSRAIKIKSRTALADVALEILRLSTFEVPHDKGMLQSSGSVQTELSDPDTVIVGYNKVYASRLHEHPEYNFQKGRKGKFLEDPIKTNLKILMGFYKETMEEVFK